MSEPITVEDLQKYMTYVKANKDNYDDFNVIMVETVLGSFLTFVEGLRDKPKEET